MPLLVFVVLGNLQQDTREAVEEPGSLSYGFPQAGLHTSLSPDTAAGQGTLSLSSSTNSIVSAVEAKSSEPFSLWSLHPSLTVPSPFSY